MTRALDDSKKESYLLIQFTVDGVSTVYRFTNWGTTIDPGGQNWVSMPAIEVKWPKNTGTLSKNGCIINGRADATPEFSELVELLLGNGSPTPKVDVEIREIIRPVKIGDVSSELVPFRGRVLRAVRNAGGRSKRVRFEVQSIKARLGIALGLPCNHHCVWALFGKGCSVQGGPNQRGPQLIVEDRLRTVTSVNGKQLTVTTDPGITAPKSFQFGYVEREGVRIGILDWDAASPTVFKLRQNPPASWVGEDVTLVPGCDKTIETCRAAWDNEDNFGGIGHGLPAYNPHFEDGA